jgi:hypothetical protein
MSRGKRHQLDIQEESKLIDELKDMNIQVVHDLIDFNSPKPTRSMQPDVEDVSNHESLIDWTGGSNNHTESLENPFQEHNNDDELDYNDNIDRDAHSPIDCSNTGYPFIPLDESTIHKDSSTQSNMNAPSSSLLLDTPRPNNTVTSNQLQMDRLNFMYPEFDPVLPVASSLGETNDLILSSGREDSANDCDLSEIPRNHPDPSSVVESTGGISLSKIQGFPSVLLDGFNEWDIGQNDKDIIEGSGEEDNEGIINGFILKSGEMAMDESEIMHSCVENLDDLSW